MKVNWRSIPALLLILSLVLTSVTPVFAQDATPATPDTATRLFLPAVLSDSQTELAQTPQPTPGPLTPGDALAPESSESAVKPEVAASTQRSPTISQEQSASALVPCRPATCDWATLDAETPDRQSGSGQTGVCYGGISGFFAKSRPALPL